MYNFQNIFSDCKIVEINKYLKMQCTVNDQTQYKCWGSDEFYIGQVDKLCQVIVCLLNLNAIDVCFLA